MHLTVNGCGMCEYCNCQAIPAIEILTREHDDALDHIRAATQAVHTGDDRALRDVCSRLIALLGPHTAVEEQALFPPLRSEFPDQITDLCREHDVLDAALAEATSTRGRAPGWEQRLEAALRLLREHIRKEQDGVFPAALSTLKAAEWDQLEQVRERATAWPTAVPVGRT
jgi:hemerythrin-like domain-containing protein